MVLALCLVGLQLPARAQMDLTFDWSQLGGSYTGSDGSDLFITFAGASSSMTIGGSINENIDFAGGTITYTGVDAGTYATSKAYSLKDVMDNGLTITSASSIIAYLSYGGHDGISLQTGNPSNTVATRYSQFEYTYSGTRSGMDVGGGIDMTNISQYGGSLKVETRASSVVQAYVSNGNTLNTGDMFRAMAAASGNSPSAVIQSGGEYVRILGSNVFPDNNPYPTFNPYLNHLTPGDLTNKIKNLAPSADHGGQGAIGVTSVASPSSGSGITGNTTYNIDYEFTD